VADDTSVVLIVVTAHPELWHPRCLYQPELELALFDMQRVYDYNNRTCAVGRAKCRFDTPLAPLRATQPAFCAVSILSLRLSWSHKRRSNHEYKRRTPETGRVREFHR
jgi:hypothetical protein